MHKRFMGSNAQAVHGLLSAVKCLRSFFLARDMKPGTGERVISGLDLMQDL
jgi:hypothetical protein